MYCLSANLGVIFDPSPRPFCHIWKPPNINRCRQRASKATPDDDGEAHTVNSELDGRPDALKEEKEEELAGRPGARLKKLSPLTQPQAFTYFPRKMLREEKQNHEVKRTLRGVRSVVMFCFLFFCKFQFPIMLHNSCSINLLVNQTCQKCLTKHQG